MIKFFPYSAFVRTCNRQRKNVGCIKGVFVVLLTIIYCFGLTNVSTYLNKFAYNVINYC